jgi:hypothetical protein
MIGRQQKTKNDTPGALGLGGKSPLFRLSATMVELSLRSNPPDSNIHTPSLPMKTDWHSAEAKVQLTPSTRFDAKIIATSEERASEPAQLYQSDWVQAKQEFLRIFIPWIRDHCVKLCAWLRMRTGVIALGLLALTFVYAIRAHYSGSGKSQQQIPATLKQPPTPLVPVTSITSGETHNDAHPGTRAKVRSRRRQGDDYVAKDTYVYYGKEGKPSR